MLNEFKTFIARGNVLDLAVGVVIGAAFTAIVNSLVTDLITPVLGVLIGGFNFSSIGFFIGDAWFGIGSFLNSVITFLIIAWVVFLVVKTMNRIMPKKEAPPAGPSDNELLAAILAELQKK